MKTLDRALRQLRFRQAVPQIASGARVLDVGTHDGALLRTLGRRISSGVGIDPALSPELVGEHGHLRFVRGFFPDAVEGEPPFDVITMLAVLEHLPNEEIPTIAVACRQVLRPGGRVVATVPSPMVDSILHVLEKFRLVDAHDMAIGQHHMLDPELVRTSFQSSGFTTVVDRSFEFGLNHLFVFESAPTSNHAAKEQLDK
jgi:SAM-dependent methyltransferase